MAIVLDGKLLDKTDNLADYTIVSDGFNSVLGFIGSVLLSAFNFVVAYSIEVIGTLLVLIFIGFLYKFMKKKLGGAFR